MKGSSSAAAPHFRLALCKAMLSCSDKYADGDRQRRLKTAEVAPLVTRDAKKAMVIHEADACLQDCRAFLGEHRVSGVLRRTRIGITEAARVH